jgi:hypothetical protein
VGPQASQAWPRPLARPQLPEGAVPPPPEAFYAVEVHGSNLAQLTEALGGMRAKAAKFGLPTIAWEVGTPHKVWLEAQSDYTGSYEWGTAEEYSVPSRWEDVYPVKVWGQVPVIDGWRLLAVISPIAGGAGAQSVNMLSPVPSADPRAVEPYRNTDLVCDHCGYVRQRKETYVVQHESGETKQVGSGCLKDFLGGKSIAELLEWGAFDHALYQLMREAAAGEGQFAAAVRRRDTVPIKLFMAGVAAAIRKHGWVSKSAAENSAASGRPLQATLDTTLDLLRKRKEQAAGRADPINADDWRATEALIHDLPLHVANKRERGAEVSTYEDNLAAILGATDGFMVPRAMGTAASGFQYMIREREEADRRERARTGAFTHHERGGQAVATSPYVGTVGERVMFGARLVRIFHYDTQYGTGTGHAFVSPEGHNLLWFASGLKQPALGDYTVTATIKEHALDKRSSQPTTFLTRVILEPPEAMAAAAAKLAKRKPKKVRAEGEAPKPGSKDDLIARALVYSSSAWAAAGLNEPWGSGPVGRTKALKARKKEELAEQVALLDAGGVA